MEITELINRLNDHAAEVVAHLLPEGKREGREWVVGSVNGEPGRSTRICLEGLKRGRWADFADGGCSGDLLDLWCAVKRITLAEAIQQVKNYLGVRDPHFEKIAPRTYRKPSAPKTATKAQAGSPVMKYLTEDRELTADAVKAYRIGEASEIGPWDGWKKQEPAKGPWIVFPSFHGENDLVSVKYLHLRRRDGKKFTLVEAGCAPCLFGWQAISPNARQIAITEGEIDAVSLYQLGFPALSVPFGGGSGNKQQWIDHEYPHLERFEVIYLCLDQDEEGGKAVAEIISRLGAHRCRVVKLPLKDANECLQKGVSPAEIRKCFEDAEFQDPGELKAPSSYMSAVVEEFYPPDGQLPGFTLPWKMWGSTVRFLRGEVTVWTGMNGHGKSLVLSLVMLHAMRQGERACIASFEMHPRKTLFRMVRQVLGVEKPERREINEALCWLDGKLWMFDLLGTAKVDRILEVFQYAHQRYGVRQFVIDSLLKCGIASDDYKGQKAFLDALNDFVNSTNSHVHLVAHSRKDDNEFTPVGKMDVKGSGDITDLASNVWSVWRNRVKEADVAKLEAGEQVQFTRAEIEKKPDSLLMCVKARDDRNDEGKIGLFFHKPSLQYLTSSHKEAERLIVAEPDGEDDSYSGVEVVHVS